MPKATVNVSETERKELKSLAGAFVVLRRMTYGESVERRAMLKMSIQGGTGGKRTFQGEMAFASREIQLFEFAHCIVDHNLEDDADRKLNLSNPVDFAQLDPRVGQEIEGLINDMNNFEDNEEALGN